MGWVTMKDLPPPCISNRDHLNDSRQGINTETEGGVLMTNVGLGATVLQEQFDLEIDSYDINKLFDMAQLAIGEPTEMREQIATIKAFSDTDPPESKRHLQA
ncbi:hypothetical protein AVEN_84028-1 [Araneus ventricosus]|uniref:Uncharacterized protein n=1 Tax=Araneus ventricosus TaxID=182803 RepID=A0A4Y2LHY4_ARAVE|nr:hypothetical protein AVEN_261361-1 [Araneus ventricosus]GBN13565.1 hypothetical protein AVEN_274098-1 [Araneus ventricosus]GBN13573.1 hypothetical protein AVEN_20408-1 [Araneus ventricosus]GBN13591.1 hypothetical protein AVEN_84028-1 [Araneus ventricosus]